MTPGDVAPAAFGGILVVLTSSWLGRVALPGAGRLDRHLAGMTLTAAIVTAGIRILGAVGRLESPPLVILLLILAGIAFALKRRLSEGPLSTSFPTLGWHLVPAFAMGAAAVALAALAAWLLPIWQWDALGYHLPFVDFALQARSLAGVPRDVPYVGTYPHGVETLMLALRLLLPDDRLVDMAQIPLGVVGATAVATIARRIGAEAGASLAAGALWLTLPAVFLQLPTNYVDVGSAAWMLAAIAFLIGPARPRYMLAAAIALALFLDSKPSAPLPAAILSLVLAHRAARNGLARWLPALLGVVLLLGARSYVRNILLHANPIWPVQLRLGPLSLPGLFPVEELLRSGAAAPHLTGALPWRVLRSWTTLAGPPVFDMRIGGLGPLFAFVALPGSAIALALRPDARRALALPLLATVATADPSVARYVLAMPALCLALSAAALRSAGDRLAAGASLGAAAAAAVGLVLAIPGLTLGGPPLSAFVRMSPDERDRAIGADGPQGAWRDLQSSLAPGNVVAYDPEFELPHQLWRGDLANRVVRLDEHLSEADFGSRLASLNARVLVTVDRRPSERWAAGHRQRAHLLFRCDKMPCAAWWLE